MGVRTNNSLRHSVSGSGLSKLPVLEMQPMAVSPVYHWQYTSPWMTFISHLDMLISVKFLFINADGPGERSLWGRAVK